MNYREILIMLSRPNEYNYNSDPLYYPRQDLKSSTGHKNFHHYRITLRLRKLPFSLFQSLQMNKDGCGIIHPDESIL